MYRARSRRIGLVLLVAGAALLAPLLEGRMLVHGQLLELGWAALHPQDEWHRADCDGHHDGGHTARQAALFAANSRAIPGAPAARLDRFDDTRFALTATCTPARTRTVGEPTTRGPPAA